jgi:ABC-2 type transport system permease protein
VGTYIEFARKKFLNNMAHKVDNIMGIIGTCLQFFIFWCFYRSVFGTSNEISGINFSMVSTNLILSLGLSNAFRFSDLFIHQKIRNGYITNEFLKPVNFKLRLITEKLGDTVFRLAFVFLPALFILMCLVKIEKPAGILALILFIICAMLGFIILWQISFIVQMGSFWTVNIWSISTIKNVVINIFSGSIFPLWFMPDKIMNIIRFTPLDLIYFAPVRLYLGEIGIGEMIIIFGRQFFWICILYAIGEIMWKLGQRELAMQED